MREKFRNSIIRKAITYYKRNHRLPNTLRITPSDARKAQNGGLYFQCVYSTKGKNSSNRVLYMLLQWNFKDNGEPEIKYMKYSMRHSSFKKRMEQKLFMRSIK
jgi:hypothetical protein